MEEVFIEFCKEVNSGFDALNKIISLKIQNNEDFNEILKEVENEM